MNLGSIAAPVRVHPRSQDSTTSDDGSGSDSDEARCAVSKASMRGAEISDVSHSGTEPWGIGGLALAPNGSLSLTPEATWYRSMRSISRTPFSDAFLAFTDYAVPASTISPPHQAPYLPMVFSADDHARLIDCAFAGPLALGMNAWRSAFVHEMDLHCSQSTGKDALGAIQDHGAVGGIAFCPALHLLVLFNGLRHCTDRELTRRYLGPGEEHHDRGGIFLEASRVQAAEEAAKPQLSTITAHLLLCSAYVGMSRE